MALALGAGTASAAVLTDTNFNSTSVGSAPSTYTVSEAGGTVRIAGTPGTSNRSVFLNDTSTTTLVSARKTFTSQSGIVDAEFKFMQPTLVNNTKVFRLLSGTTAAVSIETIGGALQYRGPNSVYTNLLSGYVANRWYSLRVVANPAINSSLTRSGSLDDTTDLGRPWRPYSSVTYLYSWMDTHIRPVGWNNWSDPANEATARYSEFGNTGPGSGTSARVSWSHVLSSSQAAAINAQSVLARTDGWNPAVLDP